jgi:hypothetical protein
MGSFRHAVGIAVATALIGALAAAPAEATHTRGKCTQKGRNLVKTDHVRVYEVERDEYTTRLYGCLWSKNKRVALADAYDDDYVTSNHYHGVRVSGRYVAWIFTATDISCKADCPPGYQETHRWVVVFDLKRRDGRSRAADAFSGYLRVNSAGAIAWREEAGSAGQGVHALDADGHRVLDTGRITYIRLSGPTLSWQNNGESRSAQLR